MKNRNSSSNGGIIIIALYDKKQPGQNKDHRTKRLKKWAKRGFALGLALFKMFYE